MHNRSFNTSSGSKWNQGGTYESHAKRPYKRHESSTKQLLEGLESKVATIPVPSEAGQSSPVSIQGLKVVASYNWLDATTPTIIVPGMLFCQL